MFPTALDTVLAYHERTKHAPGRYARALGYLDWETQPNPFRRFEGAPTHPLDEVPPENGPSYGDLFAARIPAAEIDRRFLSQLTYDSLALSAWKEHGSARWPLRVNPSSGNLHPTEGYLLCGPVPGVYEHAAIYHYAPFDHALERLFDLAPDEWEALGRGLPRGALLFGFTSIHWRESWKYGERAFRYCHHDVGHALGAVSFAAAALGWEARLLETVADRELAALLGVSRQEGVEAEHADALLALFPADRAFSAEAQRAWRVPEPVLRRLEAAPLPRPNRLSPAHVDWEVVGAVAEATHRDAPPDATYWRPWEERVPPPNDTAGPSARRLFRQRRSAVVMDGATPMSGGAFRQMLARLDPAPRAPPFGALPGPALLHLALFVHRVEGVAPGLYLLVRDPGRRDALRQALDRRFAWERADPALDLWLLQGGDCRDVARLVSCGQEIASDSAFAAAMVAEYEGPLRSHGPWLYRRLHWEAGAIGQVLYLEAEAAGLRGTGIGCFFDDLTHDVLGIQGRAFQDIYHFTTGGPIEDLRLRTSPAYAQRSS
jgi:SagB-type dehydrogenase family enzyme